MGNRKHTIESVSKYFKDQGCELLATEYINARSKMKYICKCGNESEITFDSFKNGVKCMKCSGSEKFTYNFVQNFFKEQECQLLETKYINSKTKMKYRCKCKNESQITFKDFKNGQRCMECALKIIKNQKYIFDDVYNYFKLQDCELLSKEYKSCNLKLEYKCICLHISTITFSKFLNGQRCNNCKYKTQLKLFNWLKQYYSNYTIQNEIKFEWAKTEKSYLRYDFYITELNLIIELDGKQHFEQVSNWSSPEKQQINDNLKNKLALSQGYKMIRICQQIVWNELEDWEKHLLQAINSKEELIKIGSVYKISGE